MGIDDVIDHATRSEHADNSKPAPDLVAAAIERAGAAEPAEAVFVGDAVWDVHACAKADVPCVGFKSGGTSAAELREAATVEIYRDPADLLTQSQTSPLGFIAPTT